PSRSPRAIPSPRSARSAPRWWRAAGPSSKCAPARPAWRTSSSSWSGRLATGPASPGPSRAELRRALPQGAALLLRLAARLPGRGRLPRLHRLLLPFRPRLLHHLRLRPEHHGELLADPLHRHPLGADLRHSAAHHAPPRRGAAARDARAPPHLSARRPRHLALQPLPALFGRAGRAARRLLLRLHGGLLHLGHAARAGVAPVARPAMRVGAQRLRIALALPALAGIFLLGQAILDRRAWRLDLTPERRYTLSDQGRKVLDGLPADVHVMAFLRAQDA